MPGEEPSTEPGFQIKFTGDERATSLPINVLQTSVFPVVLAKDDRVRSVGTCFAISNHGLCMTAKHVIDDVPSVGDDRQRIVDGALGILYISPDPPEDGSADLFGGFIPMSKAYTVDGVDIAVIHLSLPVDAETAVSIPFPAQPLRLDYPNEGERLLALGYELGEWTADEPGIHSLSHTFTASHGFASTVHPTGRDRVLLPTPCFQTSVPFRSGMSGGPVISAQDGCVLGVVSTGFEVEEHDEPISYATPLAPSMGLSLRGRDATGIEKTLFLWDFVKDGSVTVDQGGVKVTRFDNELLVEVGSAHYRAILES
jgi:hypothetical protein